eukprot:TRINITY_DN16031_c0_g1_i1.p1 TRINITY_DN16031_c0_g1~~TRINITY_DN16031_c0_g1_i1.p1  ORF type:complete len:221 (-),score=62.73 TRINITY_DN16031_c0_g1_i1:417-1079(-)
MSRLNQKHVDQMIREVLASAKDESGKPARGFFQTVDMLINLKNYDPQKDKRFTGFIRLPAPVKPNLKVVVIADAYHVDECKKLNVPFKTVEDLKKVGKNKKLVKKLCAEADSFLASESLIKQIPRLIGPGISRAGKFPTALSQQDILQNKIDDQRATVKFALKKVLCLGTAVGHQDLTEDQLRRNVFLTLSFLASLLKKGWQNIKNVYLKLSMGPVRQLY